MYVAQYVAGLALRCVRTLLKNRVLVIQSGLARGLKRRYGLGFRPRLGLISRYSLTEEERFVAQLSLAGKVVYDVGAYVGIYTLFFARAVGQEGTVVSFEPDPDNYKELVYNVELNNFKNVFTLNLALGSHNHPANIFRDPLYPTRSSLCPSLEPSTYRKTKPLRVAPVKVVSIDTLIRGGQLPLPDLIKIDVEGYEKEVLLGSQATLHNYHPLILIELHGISPEQISALLLSHGYNLYHIESKRILGSSDATRWQRGHHLFCWVPGLTRGIFDLMDS
ncbi:MAG: hypothetical protein DDG58_12125 [Ardenticatenia bacterium]|nr:MAG: hypothetical protein DDG58_12125 [Ardenticatenia bacterium]